MKRIGFCLVFVLLFVWAANAQTKSVTGTVTDYDASWKTITLKVDQRSYVVFTVTSQGCRTEACKSSVTYSAPEIIGNVTKIGQTVRVEYTRIDSEHGFGYILRAIRIVEVKKSNPPFTQGSNASNTIIVDKVTQGRTSDEKVYEFIVPANQWVETDLIINSNQEVLIHHFTSNEQVSVTLGGITDNRLQKAGTILPLYTSNNCANDPGVKAKVQYYCRQLKNSESVKLYARRPVRVGIAVKDRYSNEKLPNSTTTQEGTRKTTISPSPMLDMQKGEYLSNVPMPSKVTNDISAGPLISFNIPQNWRYFSGQNIAVFAPVGAYGKLGITHGLMVGFYEKKGSLEEVSKELVNRNLEKSKTFRQTTSFSQTSISGQPALVTTLSGKGEITGKIENAYFYTAKLQNGWTFYIICVAPKNEINLYKPVFNKLISSFRLNAQTDTQSPATSWNSFWIQFSTAVKNKDKAAVKNLMCSENDFLNGGGIEPQDQWLKMIVKNNAWQYLQDSLAKGTKSYDLGRGNPSKVTKDNHLLFEFINKKWQFRGVMGD